MLLQGAGAGCDSELRRVLLKGAPAGCESELCKAVTAAGRDSAAFQM